MRLLRFCLPLALPLALLACSSDEALSPVGSCSSPDAFPPGSPIRYGLDTLGRAIAAANLTATAAGGAGLGSVRVGPADDGCVSAALTSANVAVAGAPESFVIVPNGAETIVVGRDPTGAMYGLLELAERVERGEGLLPSAPIAGSPDVALRAANLFLLLPIASETEDSWWFYDDSFWTDYLDLCARARFNVLDLHGMYVLETALFPNALLYFANSGTFPDVGAPKANRDRNVAMLRKVVSMAAARGMKVGLMTYRSDLTIDGVAPAPTLTDDQVGTYTREAAADLARSVPDLWRLGFRIWESTHPPEWYVNTFVAGLNDSGTNVGLYSRSWGVAKSSMIPIAEAAKSPMVVEVKYNGEMLGPPYVIAGGIFSASAWWNYSYADYLEAPDPFTFVFQIRSGGTHRLFRHASFSRIRTTVDGVELGPSFGMSLEAAHAFFPVRDDYHASADDRFSPWTFRRDELQYMMFGRLAYDPTTPETTFRKLLELRTGTDSLWASLQAASDIVPWIQSAHTCGPDQRSFAPDLEWGGPVGYWPEPAFAKDPSSPCDSGWHGAFDMLAFTTPLEAATDIAAGHGTSKLSSLEIARIVLHDAEVARAAASAPIDPANREARDVVRECVALADLGDYFGHKLRAATALGVYAQTGAKDYVAAARAEVLIADKAWQQLAADTAYIAPFIETMRMKKLGFPVYHWSMQVPHLGDDPASIDDFVAKMAPATPASAPPAASVLYAARHDGPGLAGIEVGQAQNATVPVMVRFAQDPPQGAAVRVLWKEFSGYADWHAADAQGAGRVFTAEVPKGSRAGFYAVEVNGGVGAAWRYPDVRSGAPYVVISP
jgi:hypothetical protein